MAEESKDAAASFDSDLDDAFSFDDEEYNPLEVDDLDIDQEDMDDDNPLDTVDYPTMRNMPGERSTKPVYVPERMGGAQNAMLELIDHNPARRPVLLAILKKCENGALNSDVTAMVDELQENNRSVYSSTTLCRMLERAGGLTLEMPEPVEAQEDIEEGVQYMEIREKIDPTWTSTEDGMAVYEQLAHGAAFNDIVLDRDSQYLGIYCDVMDMIYEKPRTKVEIEDYVNPLPEVQHPRRFGGHFIDMLERTDAIEWKDHAWTMTELGKELRQKAHAAYSVLLDATNEDAAGATSATAADSTNE